MEKSIQLLIEVNSGKLAPSSNQLEKIKTFLKRQELVTVSISRPVKHRSDNQNRYYWAVLSDLAKQTGHSSDQLHEWFKDAFAPRKFMTVGSEIRELPKSTSELTKEEFQEYVDRVTTFATSELSPRSPTTS